MQKWEGGGQATEWGPAERGQAGRQVGQGGGGRWGEGEKST